MMIVMTTSSSRMVKAFFCRGRCLSGDVPRLICCGCGQPPLQLRRMLRLLLQTADDADERHEERDDDCANDEGEKDDHEQLEHSGKRSDGVIDFVVVNVRDLL